MGWREVERIVTVYLGVISAGFAASILAGGAIRFPPPTYQPLLDATGGAAWPYGMLYLASALALLAPQRIAHLTGALAGFVAHSIFSGLFIVALIKYPAAGSTAWWAYGAFASAYFAVFILLVTHPTPRER